jgi:hypothetical protein
MKKLESLSNAKFEQFKKNQLNDMSRFFGGVKAYNTYATSGTGGGAPPAGTPSDTNDPSTATATTLDWTNL